MTRYTIHTGVTRPNGHQRGYVAAHIPIGHPNWVDGRVWDFAKLMDYIGGVRSDTEVGLILSDLYRGGIGRIAMAVDGRETVVYRVTGSYTKGVRFEVDEDAALREYDYLLPAKPIDPEQFYAEVHGEDPDRPF